MKERGWAIHPTVLHKDSNMEKYKYAYIVHFDSRSFGACCQAAHIKAICSGCWVSKWTEPKGKHFLVSH